MGRPRTDNYFRRRTNNNAQRRTSVDTSHINKLFADLDKNRDRKAAIKSGLRKSGNVIKKSVYNSMKSSHPALARAEYKRGIKVSVYKNASGVRVDIFGKSAKADFKYFNKRNVQDKMFLLRFFADGTKERIFKGRGSRYKSGKSVGRIIGSNFFSRGVQSSKAKAEEELQGSIETFITKKVARNKSKGI